MKKADYGIRKIVDEFNDLRDILIEEGLTGCTNETVSRIYLAYKIHHLTYSRK